MSTNNLSYVLSAISLLSLWLMGNKSVWGIIVGLLNQILWVVYVLIGNEPYEQCYERVTKVIEWGCEPHVQPMIPLGALTKKPVVQFDWTERKLKDLTRWANKWIWRTVKFEDYRSNL